MDIHDLAPTSHAPLTERILYEVKKVVVGQDPFLERVLVAILAQGHLLVEGVPGLAKTLTVKTLARTIRGTFRSEVTWPTPVPPEPDAKPPEPSFLERLAPPAGPRTCMARGARSHGYRLPGPPRRVNGDPSSRAASASGSLPLVRT